MRFVFNNYWGTYHVGFSFWRERWGPTGFGISLGRWIIGLETK